MTLNLPQSIFDLDASVHSLNFYKDVKSCASQNQITELLYKCLSAHGVRRVLYRFIHHIGSPNYGKQNFAQFPLDFSDDAYDADACMASISDILNKLKMLDDPITAAQALAWDALTLDQKTRLSSTTLPRFPNALIIPVHAAHSRSGIIFVSFKDISYQPSEDIQLKIQHACCAAHRHFCTLQSQASKTKRSLTDRECEILSWVARGKSNSVIADIIGISQHTVNGYLRSVYLKTGTSDRTSAVLRCIGAGLLDT